MAFRHIEVEAATPTVGAYVSGVDLNQVSSKTIYAEIKLALWKHGVLFFRAQKLKPEAYLRLGQVFGDMEKHEFFPHLPDHPQIQLISHEGIDNPETDRWEPRHRVFLIFEIRQFQLYFQVWKYMLTRYRLS